MSNVSMERIVRLAKQRGFVFPSSEIYGGFASSYDYGPLGVALKNNIRDAWWKEMVGERRDVVGLDSAIITHPQVWEASGHVQHFVDPLVDCRKCKKRFRADRLAEEVSGESMNGKTIEDLAGVFRHHAIHCPECGGELTLPRTFNLLVRAVFGAMDDSANESYLRGETCQGIYLNFKNIVESSRQKVPFGIAQIGKAFRNEITLENFIYRTREFEQMEMQFFVHPDESERWFSYWREERTRWYRDVLGFSDDVFAVREQEEKERAHYAKRAVDIEFAFPFGRHEVEGVHDRGDFDLSNHMRASGVDLQYFDQARNVKFIPHVIETSAGLTRILLALLVHAYHEEDVRGETRTVMKFPASLAPVTVAVLPLSKDEKLSMKAVAVYDALKARYACQYDETQSIGRRYRRQDEIGTPLCVTVDFETLEDEAATVRHRDTMKQERVPISRLSDAIHDQLQSFSTNT